ncbi:MAG: type IV pilus modification protein PilV [Sedimenticola sp.]
MPDTIFSHREQSGTTMIEVLVTMVVLAMGLLGVAALQTQMQLSEMESYQRSQALILLNDMTGRIAANRYDATAYVTTSPLGAGMTCSTSSSTRQQSDTAEWCDALQGVAEVSGVNRVGAMVGARGCVESISAGAYMVTVAWQGLSPVTAPPTSVSCGQNLYNGATGSSCINDLCRRAVTTIVRNATL